MSKAAFMTVSPGIFFVFFIRIESREKCRVILFLLRSEKNILDEYFNRIIRIIIIFFTFPQFST